ncbi:MAG: SDR family oxidoreductase [Flavobacteriales bacterium]|nr:SDR family oxidoreductase [Flavobacteriales bacterium]MCB9449018.1 SDR family oxidoreductase [Flavobacteriales bacterium]
MEKIFNNKVALVTGGSFGIGRATAIAFAERGARVVIADVMDDGDTVQQVKNAGSEALFVKCDVSKDADVENLVAQTVKKFGRLDFAYNNAGIEGVQAPTSECTEENWDRTLGVNLKGIWLCMKHEVPVMLKNGGGAIVNCASVAGLVGFPGMPAYVASKHGVVGLTKTAALEYVKQGIRVNAVCPGVIHTPMVDRITGHDKVAEKQFADMEPIGRMGEPGEVAQAVVWLCSDQSSFITGNALAVDGGWIAQ